MRAGFLIALLLAGPAAADDDAAALGLADKTVTQAERARDLHLFGEAAWSGATLRSGGPTQQLERLSVGVLYDASFASQWRAVFDDRLDARWQQEPSDRARVNTLQDAYLSWQIQPDRIADLGRINTRYGVHEIAHLIAKQLPELAAKLPPRRKPWMNEDYHMAMFDAAALALAEMYIRELNSKQRKN